MWPGTSVIAVTNSEGNRCLTLTTIAALVERVGSIRGVVRAMIDAQNAIRKLSLMVLTIFPRTKAIFRRNEG